MWQTWSPLKASKSQVKKKLKLEFTKRRISVLLCILSFFRAVLFIHEKIVFLSTSVLCERSLTWISGRLTINQVVGKCRKQNLTNFSQRQTARKYRRHLNTHRIHGPIERLINPKLSIKFSAQLSFISSGPGTDVKRNETRLWSSDVKTRKSFIKY